jgi:hypothetical protein
MYLLSKACCINLFKKSNLSYIPPDKNINETTVKPPSKSPYDPIILKTYSK